MKLLNTGHRISPAAAEPGYADHSRLTNSLQRIVGRTPGQAVAGPGQHLVEPALRDL
jgi:AraC-like DNA-binding protein